MASVYFVLFLIDLSLIVNRYVFKGRVVTTRVKLCPQCYRTFSWRKKWENDWDQVVYCSQACKRAASRKNNIGGDATLLFDCLQKLAPRTVEQLNQTIDWDNRERLHTALRYLWHKDRIKLREGGHWINADNMTRRTQISVRR